MTQKIRIAVLVPMLALTVVGTVFTLVPDAHATGAAFFQVADVTFNECVSTATRVCGDRGVASFTYNETTGECSFTCNPPVQETEDEEAEEGAEEAEEEGNG